MLFTKGEAIKEMLEVHTILPKEGLEGRLLPAQQTAFGQVALRDTGSIMEMGIQGPTCSPGLP